MALAIFWILAALCQLLKSLTLSLVAGAPKEPTITSHENNAISTVFDALLGLLAPLDSMSAALPSGQLIF